LASRTGAQILVDHLRIEGVTHVFGVPGESFLGVLDALHDHREAIRFVTCRMEAGAANMAEAAGKLTGRPGIVMVTRGPGATHASVGVHTASQDSTPLILFIGQVARRVVGRDAFQEVDYVRMFGGMAKLVLELDRADRIPELLARAFHTAMSGRPGPVVVAMPEDVLSAIADVPDARRSVPPRPVPSTSDAARFSALLSQAARPLMIVGGRPWEPAESAAVVRLAEAAGMPVAASFRCQDRFPNRHTLYAGDAGFGINPALARRIAEADLIVALGARLEDAPTGGYSLLSIPRPAQKLVHVLDDPGELGRVYQPDLAIACGPGAFAEAALAAGLPDGAHLSGWASDAHADYLAWRDIPRRGLACDPAAIVADLDAVLPDDAIVTNGAGNYALWLHRGYSWRAPKTQLAPTSGAMGYGVPSAVAAKLLHPGRVVVSVSGDGCFMMCGQEIATAAQHGAAVVFIVMNNGMYGTIRMHQEREFPTRVLGTELANPDFEALARAYGIDGALVETTAAFRPALERALASGRSTLIEVRVDPEALSPRQTLSEARSEGIRRAG
jgi:acetolactate synthase-1/2/3 large subunit